MSSIETLKPTNRHLLVVPHTKKKETAPFGISLPEEFYEDSSRYIKATVVDIADDCSSQFKKLKYEKIENPMVVIDKTMLEEVKVGDCTHHLILENYVMGLYRRPDAH